MFRRVVCSARPLVALRPAATVTPIATRPASAAALHSAAPRRSDADNGSGDRSSSSHRGDRDTPRRGRRGDDRDRDGGGERDRFRRGGGARGLGGSGGGKSLRVTLAEEAAAEQLLVPSHDATGTSRGRLSKFAELHAIANKMAKNKDQFDATVNPRSEQSGEADDGSNEPDFLFDSQTPPPPSNKKIASQTVYENAEIPGIEFKAPVHPNSRVAVHGIGVPAVHIVQHQRPRRYLKPKSVQDVPKPMKTFTEGPREMGNKIVRTFIGHVVSDKMQKTVAVEVSQYYRHPKYHKYIKTSKKFLTHDEEEECNIGDVVEIRVCRPMSKRKHFTLHRILKPKLPIEEGARRFEAHQPEWKKSPEQIAYEQQQQQQQHQQEEKVATASS